MIKRVGMNIYRLEKDGEIIDGDAYDLIMMGIDADQVRNACRQKKPYLGYVCTVIGKLTKPEEPKQEVIKPTVVDFEALARTEHKTYGQLQIEETLGRKCL